MDEKNNNLMIKEISGTITKDILNVMAPEEIDKADIIVEEYFDWQVSNQISNKEQRLGFIEPLIHEIGSIPTWIAAIICAVMVDFVKSKTLFYIGYEKSKDTSDDTIKKIVENAYNKAIQMNIDGDEAKKMVSLLEQSLSSNKEALAELSKLH